MFNNTAKLYQIRARFLKKIRAMINTSLMKRGQKLKHGQLFIYIRAQFLRNRAEV